MHASKKPYLIEFPKIGDVSIGFISVAEKEGLPFPVKRVFWTYHLAMDLKRTAHAHHKLEQILLAVAGKIIVYTELLSGEKQEFVLDKPNVGLYLPQMCWHQIQYQDHAAQVSIASTEYDEQDYIRDYNEFIKKAI